MPIPNRNAVCRSAHTLIDKQHWLFDMDGTLTLAMHDFDAMRAELGLPEGRPILEALSQLPAAEAREKHRSLDAMELDMARHATAQPGCMELLTHLHDAGCELGIVTRNGKLIAEATLKACGIAHFFDSNLVITRDCCTAKPDPAGINLALSRWSADKHSAVMVGDYRFDLESGRNAGVTTVHLAVDGVCEWPELTDVAVQSLTELTQLVSSDVTTTSTDPAATT